MTTATASQCATEGETTTVTIDLVPYEMRREGKYWVIKDCGGSLLASLERPERLCWTRCYGDFIGDDFCEISYYPEEEECAFAHPDSDAVIEWLSQSFEKIDSIGYEALRDLD